MNKNTSVAKHNLTPIWMLVFVISALLLALPTPLGSAQPSLISTANAQSLPDEIGITPIPPEDDGTVEGDPDGQSLEELVPCTGTECDWCDVFQLLQNVLNAGIGLLGSVVVLIIMYGAILFAIGSSAGSQTQIGRAKEIVTNAITGLIIILLAFVIVNALITGLAGVPLTNLTGQTCDISIFPLQEDAPFPQ